MPPGKGYAKKVSRKKKGNLASKGNRMALGLTRAAKGIVRSVKKIGKKKTKFRFKKKP